jgi:hypothetical protein
MSLHLARTGPYVPWRVCIGYVLLSACDNIAYSQVTLPSPVFIQCELTATEINDFIKAAQPIVAANVPDNDSFPTTGVPGQDVACPFHRAAMRMFLWLTSRQDETSNDSYVFWSQDLFHDVVPAASSGPHNVVRPAIAETSQVPRVLSVTIKQSGPAGVTTVFDDTGRMYSVVRPALVQQTTGAPPKIIEEFTVDNDCLTITVRAADRSRYVIKNEARRPSPGSARLLDKDRKHITFSGKCITVNGMRVPLDRRGIAVDLDTGQADEHVLMSADGRLLYYGIRINGVYQRLHEKFDSIDPRPTKFPSTKIEVDMLQGNAPILGAKALTVSIKTSWIDVCAGITDDACTQARTKYKEKYLTLDASIPTYEPSPPPPASATLLVKQKPETPTTLALLGMHVAFTVQGVPGMVWSTFEHVNNARNVDCSYSVDEVHQKSKPFDGAGEWLLAGGTQTCNQTNAKKANVPRMIMDGDNIKPVMDQTIGAADVCRRSPWGTFERPDSKHPVPNALMIAINASLQQAFMAQQPADVRRNYMLVGTTWWPGGTMPPRQNSSYHGAKSLANSTMETFKQNEANDCLTCHRDDSSGAPLLNVSHVWRQLHPSPQR